MGQTIYLNTKRRNSRGNRYGIGDTSVMTPVGFDSFISPTTSKTAIGASIVIGIVLVVLLGGLK